MSSKRVYYILLAALVLVSILGIAGVVFGSKLLTTSAANLNEAKLEMRVLDEQQNSLTRARQDIGSYSDLETIAKTVVPQEKDQARTVREIVKFAQETKVPITSITFPASGLGAVSSTTKKTTDPALSQLLPVDGLKGVYKLEVTVANDAAHPVSYSNLVKFLDKLEQNRRTSQVSNVGLQPNADDRNMLTYNMIINVYIKP